MKKMFIISFVIMVLDIVSKRLVINFMFENESISVIDDFFRLTYAKNKGVAFSFLDGHVSFIILMTSIIIYLIFKYVRNNISNNIEIVGYSFIMSGAVGNLIDRVIYGYVVDFFDFNIFGYNFPIFNLADTFIVVGVFILFIVSFREVGDKDGISSEQ